MVTPLAACRSVRNSKPSRHPSFTVEAAYVSLVEVEELPQRRAVVHSSLYLPEPIYEALRKIAFEERVKIHDLAMEGIDAVLRKRGYPSAESLKAGKRGTPVR